MNFLHAHKEDHPDIDEWIAAHTGCVETAFSTVGSTYAEAAAVELSRIRQAVSAADPAWVADATLSQQAVRVLRSTAGVSTVLAGMRKKAYVDDVIQELGRPIAQKNRTDSWEALKHNLSAKRLRTNRH